LNGEEDEEEEEDEDEEQKGRGRGRGTKGSSKVVLMLSTSVNGYKEFLIQRKNLQNHLSHSIKI